MANPPHCSSRPRHTLVAASLFLLSLLPNAQAMETVSSPDGHIEVVFDLGPDGAPVYGVLRDGMAVLLESHLGLVRDDSDFTRGLALREAPAVERVEDRYELLTGKRRRNHYEANRRVFRLATADGKPLEIAFQVSNDGVAFRYLFPDESVAPHEIREEVTSFRFAPEATAWLQPVAVAKSGWMRTNPSYEEYYECGIPVGTPSSLGAGWVFPALFRTGATWVALTEAALDRTYCGGRLRHESPEGEYRIGFPDPRETIGDQPAHPVSTLPWQTPWRVIALGTLETLVESTLGTDLAPAPAAPPAVAPRPGKAAWSWPLLGDGQTVYDVQKRFVDYAGDMGWEYCLVDALWDSQIGYDRIAALADYARTRHVGLWLWYNSNGACNDAPQTPKDRLLTHESRLAEFARLKGMGIRGVKIDFLGGDGQPVIGYYQDLLADAAAFGLLVNFHGATLPRGWERTCPNLMTMEAVRGMEYVTFEQANADREPAHAAMLPFTRNLFDPMDFTPLSLDRLPRVERRTTAAFELALSVLFVSGVQHYVETPEGMARMPAFVRTFLREVPPVWEDTKFLAGEPGKLAVIARRGAERWYVAGINGEPASTTLTLDLSAIAPAGRATLITDDADTVLRTDPVEWNASLSPLVKLPAHGGFVLVFEAE